MARTAARWRCCSSFAGVAVTKSGRPTGERDSKATRSLDGRAARRGQVFELASSREQFLRQVSPGAPHCELLPFVQIFHSPPACLSSLVSCLPFGRPGADWNVEKPHACVMTVGSAPAWPKLARLFAQQLSSNFHWPKLQSVGRSVDRPAGQWRWRWLVVRIIMKLQHTGVCHVLS